MTGSGCERPFAAGLNVQDAVAFTGFLREIPPHYLSRRKAAPGELGWAPFRGQLTPGSRKQALIVVSAWLDWHVEAITEGAMQALLRYFEQAEPSPALHWMRFVLRFLESMGLRASWVMLRARAMSPRVTTSRA